MTDPLDVLRHLLSWVPPTPPDYATKGAAAFSPETAFLIDAQNRAREALGEVRTQAKAANMDGDSFDQWLAKLSAAIPADYRGSWGPREWPVRAFNCNYDPIAAAEIVKGRATVEGMI